jgi:hypothetical protein
MFAARVSFVGFRSQWSLVVRVVTWVWSHVGRGRIVLRTRTAHLRRAVVTDIARVTRITRITRITDITGVARVARVAGITLAGVAGVTVVLLAQGCETLLLGEGVDVGANDEGDQVEEGDPELVREELLGES